MTEAVQAPIVPAAESPEAATNERIAKYAKQAEDATVASAEAAANGLAEARGESAEKTADGDKPRGADGKFLPAKKANDGKAKTEANAKAAPKPASKAPGDAADGAKPAKPAERGTDGPGSDGGEKGHGIGRIKRLVADGKIADALAQIGLSPDKLAAGQWKAWRIENQKAMAKVEARRQEVEARHEATRADVRAIVEEFKPYVAAKQAYEAGDYEEFFKLTTGEDLNTFQRKALAKLHGAPNVAKDPVVAELRKKNEELMRGLETFKAELQAKEQAAELSRLQAEYKTKLTGMLADSDDARMARAAEDPSFVEDVRKELLKHYDPETDTSIPELEAAELVLERIDQEAERAAARRRKLYGEDSPAETDRSRSISAASDRGATPVRRAAKAPTTLSRSEAADPAPTQTMTTEQRIAYYARLAAQKASSA